MAFQTDGSREKSLLPDIKKPPLRRFPSKNNFNALER